MFEFSLAFSRISFSEEQHSLCLSPPNTFAHLSECAFFLPKLCWTRVCYLSATRKLNFLQAFPGYLYTQERSFLLFVSLTVVDFVLAHVVNARKLMLSPSSRNCCFPAVVSDCFAPRGLSLSERLFLFISRRCWSLLPQRSFSSISFLPRPFSGF